VVRAAGMSYLPGLGSGLDGIFRGGATWPGRSWDSDPGEKVRRGEEKFYLTVFNND